MADFRKWLFAFAFVALLLGASMANAQVTQVAPFTCVANAGAPVIVRAEGITELVGDLLIQCTGGTPTAAGAQVPVSNISLTLNTNVTSKLLGTANGSSQSFIDALLLIDDPFPASPNPVTPRQASIPNQKVCYSNGTPASAANCNYLVGTGGGGIQNPNSPYLAAGASTVFVGQQGAVNQVAWLGIPVDPPGTTGTRSIRMTNVRANACQIGLSSTLIPTQIVGYVSVTGSQTITISNPQQTLAYIQQGLITSGSSATLSQCTNLNVSSGSLSSSVTSATTIKLQEGFAASFKRAVFTGSNFGIGPLTGSSTAGGVAQNVPGFSYNTESGFMPDGGGTTFGQANAGTRILIVINNIGSGASVVVPNYVALTGSNTITSTINGTTFTGGFLQLVGTSSDLSGNVSSFLPGAGSSSFSGYSAPFGIGRCASDNGRRGNCRLRGGERRSVRDRERCHPGGRVVRLQHREQPARHGPGDP